MRRFIQSVLSLLIMLFIGALGAWLALRYFPEFFPSPSSGARHETSWEQGDTVCRAIPRTDFEQSFINASAQASPSVVHVHVQSIIERESPYKGSIYEFFFGPQPNIQQRVSSSGSGVIVSSDGLIVTNNHVVAGAKRLSVTLTNQEVLSAEIVARDPAIDLALLRVRTSKPLPAIRFGSADSLRVGSWVLAIGNPFDLETTVTAGIVSAKARSLNLQSGRVAIESFIQVDAAVNPGNSGGALVNLQGELVGINTAIASPTGSFAGYAFSIPENIVRDFLAKVEDGGNISDRGKVERGVLGVVLTDLSPHLAKALTGGKMEGVVVAQVRAESAAAAAGLRQGDVLIAIDGKSLTSVAQVHRLLGGKRPGTRVRVTYIRNKVESSVEIVLQASEG